jgi:uncharacterized protein (DUF2141 family)
MGVKGRILNLMFAHKQPAVALWGQVRLPRVRTQAPWFGVQLESRPAVKKRLSYVAAMGLLMPLLLGGAASQGAELVVNVSGLKSADGFLGCALFAESLAERFPLDVSKATTQRAPARAGSMRCEFVGLPAGRYAVSASHDANGNGKTDRNFVGLPTEPWAVSNNMRPTLRAPRFAEAAVQLAADEVKQLELRLAD